VACHLAGRSLRASWPSLTPWRLHSAILTPLAAKAGSMAAASTPRSVW